METTDSDALVSDGMLINGTWFPAGGGPVGEAQVDKYKYSATRFNSNFFMPTEPAAMLFVGRRGLGKTTKMLGLLNYMDYDSVAIFSMNIHQDKIRAIAEAMELEEKHTGEELPFLATDDLSILQPISETDKRSPYILSRIQMNKECGTRHHLVILDDMEATTLGAKAIQDTAISQLVLNGRPAGITCAINAQNFFGIDEKVRANVTHLALFGCIAPDKIKMINRKFATGCDGDKFLAMYRAAVEGPGNEHSFFFVDNMTNIEKLKYRRNFDELLL